MIRDFENRRVIHVVRELDGIYFAVVLDIVLHRIIFGDANKSDVLTKTGQQLQKVFVGHCSEIDRHTDGGRVVAVVARVGGRRVELHPTSPAAADACEAYVLKKVAEVESAQHSA